LIKTVEQRARELEEARDEERVRTRALEKERNELLRKQQQLEAEIEKVRERARTELLDEITKARAQTKSMIAELQRAVQRMLDTARPERQAENRERLAARGRRTGVLR